MSPMYPVPLSVHTIERTKPHASHRTPRRTYLPVISPATTLAVRTSGDAGHPSDPDQDTDAFKEAMWAGQANILVTVRVRPPCAHDRDQHEIVRVLDHKMIVVLDKHHPLSPSTTGADSPQRGGGSRTSVDPFPASVSALPRRTSSHTITGNGTRPHGLRKLRTVASAHPSRIPLTTMNQSNNHTRSREKRYAFDHVFTAHDSQQTVYHHTTKFLIHGVLHGFNATVFAYGCTGAGKTYTMLGTPDEPGIMALTLDDLFQNIATAHADPLVAVQYKVTVSFLEVYNENIRDLLVTPPLGGLPGTCEFLDLREDPIKGSVVAGISEVEACNAYHVMQLLRRGNKHRSQEATAANAVSSRSHAVLQVLVEQRDKLARSEACGNGDGGEMTSTIKYGKLSLVDLAGSERAAVTQNRGQRLIEGANINRSLLALGNCINALGEKGGTTHGNGFVPYRDSKLTRLLKDSLGGNCRTVMIANVSPAAASVEETLNTLKYANRAKNIKTTVTRNVLHVDHHLTEYATVVAALTAEIATLKKQLAIQSSSMMGAPRSSSLVASPGQLQVLMATNGDEQGRDEAWPLGEAREYIGQCFQQRQQLQCSLVEINHCIDELTRQHQLLLKLKLTEEDRVHRPEITSRSVGETETSREKCVGDGSPTQLGNDVGEDQLERLEVGIRQLVARKTELIVQLEHNYSVMDTFRMGIQQSPLVETNALLRDLLLMEYRVGDLQVENALFATTHSLKDHQISALQARLTGQPPLEAETSNLCRTLGACPPLPLPLPSIEMPQLLSARRFKRREEEEETPENHSPRSTTRSTTRFAFLDELRARFYDRTKTPQVIRPRESNVVVDKADRLSPRRQWGIHLNSTTLPYIRLKKKSVPPPTAVGSKSSDNAGSSKDPAGRHTASVSGSHATTTSTATANAAPYLTVLKHRRKLQHRSSTNSTSLTKLPLIQS